MENEESSEFIEYSCQFVKRDQEEGGFVKRIFAFFFKFIRKILVHIYLNNTFNYPYSLSLYFWIFRILFTFLPVVESNVSQ